MRRALAAAIVLAPAALLGLGAPGSLAGGGVTSLGVTGTEFDLVFSRPKVDPGDAEVEYVNAGEDPHDLKIRRKGSLRVYAIGEVGSGDPPATINLRFKRDSRYVFWCSTLDGLHRSQGMEATLRVRRK